MNQTAERPPKSTQDWLAVLISGGFSPFITIPYFATWVIRSYADAKTLVSYEFLFVGLTVLLPLAWILFGIKRGKISDLHVKVREQRAGPFLLGIAGSLALVISYWAISAPRQLQALALDVAVNAIAFYLMTQKWKVSVHAAAYAAGVTIAWFLVASSAFWLIIFLPAIIWARMRRKRHSLNQALLATVAVVVLTLATFFAMGLTPVGSGETTVSGRVAASLRKPTWGATSRLPFHPKSTTR